MEHYRFCPTVKRAGFNVLDLPAEAFTARAFLLVDPDRQSDADLTKMALLIYGVYRAVHTCRFTRPATPLEAYDMICSYIGQAAHGHAKATATLDFAKVREPRRGRPSGRPP